MNSLESFEESYRKGARLFEIDFCLTSDGVVVPMHDNECERMGLQKGFTYAEWTNNKDFPSPHNVTRMDMPMLMELFKKYPDAKLVTDHKANLDILQSVIECFQQNDIALNRLIPQLYDFHDLDVVKKYPDIDTKIFTMYMVGPIYKWMDKEPPALAYIRKLYARLLMEFYLGRNKDIGILTMSTKLYQEGYLNYLRDKLGVKIYVHPADNMDDFLKLYPDVDGVYTGRLVEEFSNMD